MSYEFKVGDKVGLGDYKTSVSKVMPVGEYPVQIYIFNIEHWFALDGTPSNGVFREIGIKLKLRKFKKKPVPREIWMNVYKTQVHVGDTFSDQQNADFSSDEDRIGGKAWRYVLAKEQK